MRRELSSRERLLCAMQRQEPDHVPLWSLWRNREVPFRYTSQVERAEAVLALGLDDTLLLEPPLNKTEHYDANRVPGVEIRVWREEREGERYPLLAKEYQTPAGPLRQVVRRTEDWPYGEDVRLFSDHNISRSLQFPVKGPEDLPRLRHLLCRPGPERVSEFRQAAADLCAAARRLEVVLEGGWTALGDAALWLLGTEALLYLQMDQPGFLEELLDLVCDWELARMDLLLAEGVDVIVHSAWYESTDFWTPRNYRRLLKPRLERLVRRAHEGGALFSYIITTSWQALAEDLIEIGIDSLVGVDPVQGKADLREAKRRLGPHMCLWGGINGALTLGRGTPEEVRQATAQAIRTLGPGGGFVLCPVDQIVAETPWRNVQAMVDCWREAGRYPIKEGAT
ncbi:MAG: uroporphyrinogen decarboxylase family protein [Anaerolineae bacterium]|nr:uroporphyrinogen decarboxylase family protein [Anaerolineae bacterium]